MFGGRLPLHKVGSHTFSVVQCVEVERVRSLCDVVPLARGQLRLLVGRAKFGRSCGTACDVASELCNFRQSKKHPGTQLRPEDSFSRSNVCTICNIIDGRETCDIRTLMLCK